MKVAMGVEVDRAIAETPKSARRDRVQERPTGAAR
jgi:hypothetical protein